MAHSGTQQKFQIGSPLIAAVCLLLAWQLADQLLHFNELIFPSPLMVAHAVYAHGAILAGNAVVTTLEAVAGFLLASVLGLALASIATFSKRFGEVITPFAVAIKATPIIVLAPLLIMWLGNGYGSKVVMAMLASFFPILVNAYLGLTSVDAEWISLMRLHKASRWQIFLRLRLPHALPEIFAGLKIACSLAMVGAVVAEFTGAERGLGNLIATSTFYLNIDLVFAGVFILSGVGIVFYGCVVWIGRKMVFWETAK